MHWVVLAQPGQRWRGVLQELARVQIEGHAHRALPVVPGTPTPVNVSVVS